MYKHTIFFFLSVSLCFANRLFAFPPDIYHLMIAPGTVTEESITILWDKLDGVSPEGYDILLNNKKVGNTAKTNFTIDHLAASTPYRLYVICRINGRQQGSYTISFKTAAKGRIYNILDFGAKADSTTKNTKAIQDAINACSPGGTVYVPKGTFLSGALFLKSDMTLYLEKGAVLQGSLDTTDYLPLIMNRFEGWELNTYASLLNAGTLDRKGGYKVKNLRIAGEGTLAGGGKKLGEAMIKARGIRSRARLICLMNCQEVAISGITVTEPPAWTIHYIYSDKITCQNLAIKTYGIRNGDGIDPDSSTDCYIFNCTFDTGDDCIAIKSGKNPEGFYVGKPTKNVRITDCNFIKGHGISIGSEMSGGVSDVLVQDCKAGALLNGMQIKGTKERGGYVRNVVVRNCALQKITVFTSLNYNNDGEAAPEIPTFENFSFRDIDLSGAPVKEPVITINGFKDPAHRLKNVFFGNIVLPEGAKVIINDAEQIRFSNVKTVNGNKPEYTINESGRVDY